MANETPPKVLLVDDDKDLLQLIAMRLTAAGYAVTAVESGAAALASLAVARPLVVVTDLRMHGMDGMALFDAIHREAPSLPVVILTAHGTIPEAVTATRRGVFSFLTKPFEPKVLLDTVAEAMRLSSPPSGEMAGWRSELITRSSSMEDLLAQARRVAASDASVCIFGQSGTGKELLARAIHRASPRAERPFVAVNCGAIPEGLLESELFGHKKGSFTGAVADRRGLFSAAQGGTLFLDEVGDMPLSLQVKLLRALEERKIRQVGSHESYDIDVRVVSATHRKLEERIASGEFREDLYYRLNVVKLYIPALAERREDIPLLANHFLTRLAERYRRGNLAFSRVDADPGLRAVAGQCAAAAQRGGAGGRARHHRGDPGVAGAPGAGRGRHHAHAARRGAPRVRARLPGAHPQDHRRQRHQGRAARGPQPHRVLPPARASFARAGDVQG